MRGFLRISIFALAVVLISGNAMALPFSSTGVVDSNFGGLWNETNRTGVAQFSLFIDTPGINVNVATLEFESDIFDLNALDVSDFTVLNPTGWTTPVVYDVNNSAPTDDAKVSVSMAGVLATSINDPIIIQFSYTLLGAEMFDQASGNGWEWNEGQAWGVSYLLADTTQFLTTSTGSTAPVPEPATMLLLGTGLAGMAAVRRRKARKG